MNTIATNHPTARASTRPLASPLANAQADWWPPGTLMALDFVNRRYMADAKAYGTFTSVPGVGVSRSSRAWGLTVAEIPVTAAIDEPLIVPARGLLSEPAATRLNDINLLEATIIGGNTDIAAITTTLPDGTSGTAYRVTMPAMGGTFVNITDVLPAADYTIQVWAKATGGPDMAFALAAGGSLLLLESTLGWHLFSLTQAALGGVAATINNHFDTFATDVLFVWPDVQAGSQASPILEPGSTATRAAAAIEISGITSIPGIAVDHAFTATFEDATTSPLIASGGTLTIPVSAKAYSLITG